MDVLAGSFFEVVAVGASLGGLRTLQRIVACLPRTFPTPILIVQHLADGRRSWFAELLGQYSALPVRWAEDGEPLSPGTIYVAPPGHHLIVAARGVCALTDTPPVNFARPASNALFLSIAEIYRQHAIGVVLSGRLDDGAAGALAMRKAGAIVIAQDPSTCRAPGMPRAAIRAGAVDHVLAPERITTALVGLTSSTPAGSPHQRQVV